MAGALHLLLIGCLLQGALGLVFTVSIPKSIEPLNGSCVTIPCSFDIENTYKENLGNTCKAIWKNTQNENVFESADQQQTKENGELKGILTEKDCTTTLSNINSNIYYLRLDCNNTLKYDFKKESEWLVNIQFKPDPPSPTLTPPTLEEKEGTSVRLTCSAPAPCWSYPPTLTWTTGLGDPQETLEENLDKTKFVTSVLTFTASHLHHGRTISCTATYNKQDGSTVPSVSRALTLNITYAPQILSTSGCTKTAAQFNCSCETVGNPPPILQWHSDELPLNQSDKYEALGATGLQSYITVSQPQERDRFTLLCRSSNSVGSVTQRYYVLGLGKKECSHEQMLTMLIIIAGVQTAALISALLFAIRTQWTGGHNPSESQCTGDTGEAVMRQGLTRETENEVSITEEDIYVNTNMMRMSDKPNTRLGHQQASIKSSERTNEKDSDVIYSSVIWKSKRKKGRGRSGYRNPSGSCYPEESIYDNVMPGRLEDARKEVCTEYAPVNL